MINDYGCSLFYSYIITHYFERALLNHSSHFRLIVLQYIAFQIFIGQVKISYCTQNNKAVIKIPLKSYLYSLEY